MTRALLASLLVGVACSSAAPRSPSPATATTAPLTPSAIAARELEQLIADDYSYRDVHQADWPSVFAAYRTKLEAATAPSEFATLVAEVLAAAHDVHITVSDGTTVLPTFHRHVTANFALPLIAQRVPDVRSDHRCVSWGHAAPGVGYLLIGQWTTACARSAEAALDALLDDAALTALVVDVRLNNGGDERTAQQFAARFVTAPVVYERDAIRAAGRTSGLEPHAIVPAAPPAHAFHVRVAVLMGPYCMSSNESFLLMMRAAGAVLVGDRSYGASGNPRPHRLANGVIVNLPSWLAYQPDGTLLELHGIAPDVTVSWPAAPTDDVVLAAAVGVLAERKL